MKSKPPKIIYVGTWVDGEKERHFMCFETPDDFAKVCTFGNICTYELKSVGTVKTTTEIILDGD